MVVLAVMDLSFRRSVTVRSELESPVWMFSLGVWSEAVRSAWGCLARGRSGAVNMLVWLSSWLSEWTSRLRLSGLCGCAV